MRSILQARFSARIWVQLSKQFINIYLTRNLRETYLAGVEQVVWIDGAFDGLHQLDSTLTKLVNKVSPLPDPDAMLSSACNKL